MADMLNIGVSGLLAFQRALDTTSHNISNANTPGYSVQTAELATRQADRSGNGWVGNGVNVSTITRSYDDFVANQVRSSSSTLNYFDTYSGFATHVNNLLGDSSTGLTASLQGFTNAVQAVADTPTSVPARQTLLSQAQTLQQRLQSFDGNLQQLDAQVNSQFDTESNTISQLAQNIAQMNQRIVAAQGSTGQPPNDLLDQRDKLIDDLSTHVNVSTVVQSDGSANVFIGSGQSLVVGANASKLVTGQDGFDATRKTVLLQTSSGTSDVTASLSGGTLGGALDFRTQLLDPARNTLGRLSVALAQVVNDQQGKGIDLNGAPGAALFAVGAVDVRGNSSNTGSGTVTVTRSNVSGLTNADYVLRSTASGWTLTRADTGAAVAMTGSGTVGAPFVAAGLSIVVGGSAATGDRYLIQPTRSAVSGLKVLIDDPAGIAAAAPIIASAGSSNAGTAKISSGEVLDATNAQLLTSTTITFQDATHYVVSGDVTVHTYTAGGNIDANGWRVQIAGAASAGDVFTVKSNVNGVGDNRNALKLVDVLSQPILNGGTASLNAAAGQFIGSIGVATNQAQTSAAAQKVAYNDSLSTQQSKSGVNLDEEAAKLLRYQQAYQAAAQVIKIAQTLFDTLISATGR